ncbi:Ribosome biogenesis protein BOP1-like protein, partial [Frankliniella fusca]
MLYIVNYKIFCTSTEIVFTVTLCRHLMRRAVFLPAAVSAVSFGLASHRTCIFFFGRSGPAPRPPRV